jgi:hypothetical protein
VFLKDVSVKKEADSKVFRLMFDKPVIVKAGEHSSCICEFKAGNSYYGTDGKNVVHGDSDVIFNFADSAGSSNGTSMSSGQVPEIYYYV